MNKHWVAALILATCLPTLQTPAAAQSSACPGGEAKTADGKCVDPALSSSLRLRGILLSQPRISETAFPIPPSQDRVYPRPNEYNRYELTRGIFSTNPSPFSCHPACVVPTAPRTFTTAR
jgi:hypothetical protein